MPLFCAQHGKNQPASTDPEKGLSEEGRAETIRIAQVAAGYQVRVSRILHSGKKRARETAEIFNQYLSPEQGLGVCDGMNPLDDVESFVKTINMEDRTLLVGHLPFLDRLISLLVCGRVNQKLFKLQNSGLLCIDSIEETKNPVIRWALMPNIGG